MVAAHGALLNTACLGLHQYVAHVQKVIKQPQLPQECIQDSCSVCNKHWHNGVIC